MYMIAYDLFVKRNKSDRHVTLDKQTSVCPVSIVETWRQLLSLCVLKVKGTKSNKACQDDQHCARLK